MEELLAIASSKDWPGYFGSPDLASGALGLRIYAQWLERGTDLVKQMLAGNDYRKLPRYGDLYADDPSDATAVAINQKRAAQQEAWLKTHSGKDRQ